MQEGEQQSEGRMTRHRQVSDIRSDFPPAAPLSKDPDSMVPGRDYPMAEVSALRPAMMRQWGGGGSDKVGRGTDGEIERG